MRDAMAEKIFLLFHNLARNLDDRALPLVERLDQPVGAGEAFGPPGFRIPVMLPAGRSLIIASVHEQARSCGVVDLLAPATCAFHHEQVGNDGLDRKSTRLNSNY